MIDRVQEYLRYIGVDRIREPDLDFLRELQSKHLLTVPFENWDIHTGKRIILEEDRLVDKVLVRRRGGFCYELNTAYGWLLEQLGYKISRLSARVVKAATGEPGPDFDHLTLLVHLGDPYISDVGYGASSDYPLPLSGDPVVNKLTTYRIQKSGSSEYICQSIQDGQWHNEYFFDLSDHSLTEFVEMCNYHQTSPESTFLKGTLCTRATPQGRIWIRGTTLVEATPEGKTERLIATEERDQLLKELFNVDIAR